MYTDGILVLTLNDIRAMYPNTSFPASGPSESWLNSRNLYFLAETEAPSVTASEVAYEDGVEEVSGEWRVKWSVREMTSEELSARDNDIIENLKAHRDFTFSTQTVTLSNGAELRVDERTRRDTNDVFMGMNNANISEYAGWNAVNGSYTMSLAHFQEYSVLALQEVAKAFTAYNDTIAQHGSEPFANAQEAMIYFDNEYGGS